MPDSLKLYYDLMSQPSRAIYMFLKKANISFESVPVALRKGEHLQEEFKKINKVQKVPCIVDQDGFNLAESIAILRYLEREYGISDFWYPKESKQRARVDEYLEWQHNNTRSACDMYFEAQWLKPLVTGKTIEPKVLKQIYNRMVDCLDVIENVWLDENNFLGGDNFSIADVFAVTEIEQTRITGYKPFEGRPKLSVWYESVKMKLHPYYDEAHLYVNKIAEQSIVGKSKL